MYVDTFYSQKKNIAYVAERVNGNRILKEYPVDHVFYYTHPSGTHRSLYGEPCKLMKFNDIHKFRKELGKISDELDKSGKPKYKIYESDINPIFRTLEKHYKGADAPSINTAFFDIETGFHQERGFAPVTDPFNEITAISTYLSHLERLVTLVLCPPTLTMEEAQAICDRFPDTFLFDDEKEFLRTWMSIIEDVDCLSGWNCIAKTEPVWLKDRIKRISHVKTSDNTYKDGSVLATNNSGLKRANHIVLSNGHRLVVSDEHRIPFMIKDAHQYKNPNTLANTMRDYTVAEAKTLLGQGKQLFVEMALRKNTNEALTYRKYLEFALDETNHIRYESVDLDCEIPTEIFQSLGMMFAKGTTICNDIHLKMLLPMIHNGDKKRISLELCSLMDAEQFTAFASGLIDGDGWISKKAIHLCNYDGSIPDLCNLFAWNGVYVTSNHENRISIPSLNGSFINKLNILHPKRRLSLQSMDTREIVNCCNKDIAKFVLHDKAIVAVKNIIETNELVDMADIMTQNSYFTCGGMKVHNSTYFDIPYIVNRIKRLIDEDATRDLCLWNQKPRQRIIQKYGKDHETYDLVGRVHLDYLELYQKHNPQQQHSYRLDYIGEVEVGENKVPYDGTLDDLYKKDFYKFIEYSRQDVALLVKIDKKKRFIELANQIAHVNCVQFKTTMGSVALVEQAIILEMHDQGLVAPNRKSDDSDDYFILSEDDDEDDEDNTKQPVVGAYVAKPKVGLHSHVAAIDINSLYPSTIRALNISPETIVGQIRLDETKALIASRIAQGTPRAEAWDGIFAALEVDHVMEKDDMVMIVDFDAGYTKEMTGKDLYDYIFNQNANLCISANGTIFKTDKDGIIPQLLERWYSERKSMQANKKAYENIKDGIALPPELLDEVSKLL